MIRRVLGSKLLRLFSTAVADQAMLSAANLAIGLLLIRYTTAQQYGYFVLVLSGIMLAVSAQRSWIGGPLSVIAPKKSDDDRREMVGVIEQSQRKFVDRLTVVVMWLPLAGYLVGVWSELDATVATAAILACWAGLRREFMRTILLIYSRPGALFIADALYVVVLTVGAILAVNLPGPTAVWAVLALLLASLAGAIYARRRLEASPGWVQGSADAAWAEMRSFGIWATAGATVYWVYTQSYNFVLAGKLDMDAVAHVNAARLMLMPTFLLMVGVGGLLGPNAAMWLHRDGASKLMARLWMFILGIFVLDLIYLLLLWIFRDWITTDLMRTTIPDRDLLILLWATHSGVSMVRDVLQCGLAAFGRFKIMAGLTASCATLSLLIMWFTIDLFGPAGAMMGTLAGETLSLFGVAFLLLQSTRKARAALI